MSGTIRIKLVAAHDDRRRFQVDASSASGDRVSASRVSPTEFVLDGGADSVRVLDADSYEIIAELVVGEPTTERIDVHLGAGVDPRSTVRRVEKIAETVNVRHEAQAVANEIVTSEVERRRVQDTAVARDVRRVLSSIRSNAPGVLQVGDSVREAVDASAAQWAGADKAASAPTGGVRPPASTVATDGSISDDAQLAEGASLSAWVLGRAVGGDGVLRRSPMRDNADMAIRARMGLDEAINPVEPPGTGTALNGPVAEALHDQVLRKTGELVEAIGLPPEGALIVDDDETGVSGGAVQQWSGGLADVPAFHDFHELALALPDVWQEIFDQTFVDHVAETVDGLHTHEIKGTDQEPPDDDPNDAGPKDGKAFQELLQDAHALENALADTPTGDLEEVLYSWNPLREALDYIGDKLGIGGSGTLTPTGGTRPPRPRPEPRPGGEAPRHDNGGRARGVRVESTPVRDRLLKELKRELLAKHSFTVFAADGNERAINFGALVTWRQTWDPLTYQTGRIVSTMTLAPGESRKITTKTRRVRKRHAEEARKGSTSESNESSDTSRAESEILRGAEASTNFTLTSGGSTNMLVADGNFTTTTKANNKQTGSTTRKRFRESVVKSANEYKSEVSTNVSSDSEDFFEEERTSSIENKNDEIALNAIFYELQRRYEVYEQLYRMRPVVLVALPMPNPADITAGWLIRYDWIIRRSLLDNSFLDTLSYLSSEYAGDGDVLTNLANAVKTHRQAVDDARIAVASSRALTDQRAGSLSSLRTDLAGSSGGDSFFGEIADKIFANPARGMLDSLFGGSDDQDERERQALLLEAAEDELQRAERKTQEAQSRLQGAESAFQQSVRDHVAAKRKASNWEVLIARLQLHVKDNILHYMQSIWVHTMPDQMMLDLHDVHVPVITGRFRVAKNADPLTSGGIGGATADEFEAIFDSAIRTEPFDRVPLIEIADIDELLGFKGNYAIFPMHESNPVTDIVMAPYLDEHELLRDPSDPAANWTLTKLQEHADALRELGTFEEHREYIEQTLSDLLADSRPSVQEIVVPTDSLYVDLLRSGGKLLEPFKELHRAIDLVKARGEARELELENLRRAARLGVDELSDPDIGEWEKQLVIEND